jgi:2'-5' RNA ligase superfamily
MTGPYLVTTVNIVAPVSVQEHVGRLHRMYQPERPMKVPAHFSVLHPFVGYRELDEGLERLRGLCARLAPVEIVVEGYAAFPGVVYLKASDPEPLRAISRALCGEFPECPLYGGDHGPELNPHVTVFEPERDTERLAGEMPAYEPVNFTARALHVYYGNADIVPWLTAAVIPLGG